MAYRLMHSYPHMRPQDVAIWNRYILANPDRFKQVFYDYHLGENCDHGENETECVGCGFHDVCRWKCDVIAYGDGIIYTIEIKPDAGAKAIGQAIVYKTLFELQEKPNVPIVAVILTDTIAPLTKLIAHAHGVELWQA